MKEVRTGRPVRLDDGSTPVLIPLGALAGQSSLTGRQTEVSGKSSCLRLTLTISRHLPVRTDKSSVPPEFTFCVKENRLLWLPSHRPHQRRAGGDDGSNSGKKCGVENNHDNLRINAKLVPHLFRVGKLSLLR